MRVPDLEEMVAAVEEEVRCAEEEIERGSWQQDDADRAWEHLQERLKRTTIDPLSVCKGPPLMLPKRLRTNRGRR